MNWAQFKGAQCYLCLHGTVVARWIILIHKRWGRGDLNTPFLQRNSTGSVDSLEFV